MSTNDQILSSLQATLNEAIRAGDVRAESVARVNIACAHLQLQSPKAVSAFEEALTSVRRAQNPRSEGILSTVFAPYFAEHGDPARALELATRGEQIARQGRIGHRVLANIQLARVLYTAYSDADAAGNAVDIAVALLNEGEIMNPTDREAVVQAAGPGAKAAVQAGDMNRALALLRIVDPAGADRLAKQRPQTSAGLAAAQRNEVTRLYSLWQARLGARKGDARVATMHQKTTNLLKWDNARARRSGSSGKADVVCSFVERVHAVASGAQRMAAALAAPRIPITDDDVVFVVGLATDPAFNGVLPAWAVFELAGAAASDPALAGRCYRLAAAIGSDQRPPTETLSLFERADRALAPGVDDPLHAEVLNEIAVCHLNLRQPGEALKVSKRASAIARSSGLDALERMARGNCANALLGLQRVGEALALFEALARDQTAAGEHDMARITGQNIAMCRAYLRQHGESV